MKRVQELAMRDAVRLVIAAIWLAGALAAPAVGQTIRQPQTIQQQMQLNVFDAQLRAREAMANRQAVFQQNQLSSLGAQLSTEQSLADVRAQSYAPPLPTPPPGAAPYIDTSQLASMPDDRLAASNARVREAAANHH